MKIERRLVMCDVMDIALLVVVLGVIIVLSLGMECGTVPNGLAIFGIGFSILCLFVALAASRLAGHDWRKDHKWLQYGCHREMTREEYGAKFSRYQLWSMGFLKAWEKEDAAKGMSGHD